MLQETKNTKTQNELANAAASILDAMKVNESAAALVFGYPAAAAVELLKDGESIDDTIAALVDFGLLKTGDIKEEDAAPLAFTIARDAKRLERKDDEKRAAFIIKQIENGNRFKRVKNDVYGNPRYVLDFALFLQDHEETGSIDGDYDKAVKNAKKAGGRKYRGKDFGGGIVFTSYNLAWTLAGIIFDNENTGAPPPFVFKKG